MVDYPEYLECAKNCTSYKDAERLIKIVENDCFITDKQYYNIKYVALNAAYKSEVKRI